MRVKGEIMLFFSRCFGFEFFSVKTRRHSSASLERVGEVVLIDEVEFFRDFADGIFACSQIHLCKFYLSFEIILRGSLVEFFFERAYDVIDRIVQFIGDVFYRQVFMRIVVYYIFYAVSDFVRSAGERCVDVDYETAIQQSGVFYEFFHVFGISIVKFSYSGHKIFGIEIFDDPAVFGNIKLQHFMCQLSVDNNKVRDPRCVGVGLAIVSMSLGHKEKIAFFDLVFFVIDDDDAFASAKKGNY